MALPPWPLTLFEAQATRPQWQNPQEACQGRATQVRRLSLWRYDKDSLARQRDQGFSRSLCRNQAGGMRFRRPNDIDRVRVCRTIKRQTHQEALLLRYRLRQPLQLPAIRAPSSQ